MAAWRHVILLLSLRCSRIIIMSAFPLNQINCANNKARKASTFLNYYSCDISLLVIRPLYTCVLTCPTVMWRAEIARKTWHDFWISVLALAHTHRLDSVPAAIGVLTFSFPAVPFLSLSSCLNLSLFPVYLAVLFIPVVPFRATVFLCW